VGESGGDFERLGTQEPDSFLERFRGPEVRAPPSRRSNNQPDTNGNTKGNT
ncbi:hypothetical protein M9458_012603, partial [Cirrhinus mrigala]